MRNIIYLSFLILSSQTCIGKNTTSKDNFVNAKTFGCKGDGSSDDQASLTKALNYALINGLDLFIPSGTYLLKTSARTLDNTISLIYCKPGLTHKPYKIRVYGEEGTKISTSISDPVKATRIIHLQSAFSDCSIENIIFENTHSITSEKQMVGQKNAIVLSGTKSNNMRNFTISNCKFEGFSTAITFNGTKDCKILNCSFGAKRGRDDAQGFSTKPAVFIWLMSNNNGLCLNTTIKDCIANGFTGTDLSNTVTKSTMDGFIYGSPIGGFFSKNRLYNFCEEGIATAPYLNYLSESVVRIEENVIDCNLPDAIVFSRNKKKIRNWGIRCEARNSIIKANTIYNATNAIFQYAYNKWNYKFNNWVIVDNVIINKANKTNEIGSAIFIQGYSSKIPAENTIIANNRIHYDNVSLVKDIEIIHLADCAKPVLRNNTVNLNQVNLNNSQIRMVKETRVNGVALFDNKLINNNKRMARFH